MSPAQQHQSHRGAWWKCRFSGPSQASARRDGAQQSEAAALEGGLANCSTEQRRGRGS